MTNKEELIKEWKEFLSQQSIDNKICCEPIIDIEELSDWWLSKLEQIRKEDMERVEEKIENIRFSYPPNSEREILAQKQIKDEVLSIIKQEND